MALLARTRPVEPAAFIRWLLMAGVLWGGVSVLPAQVASVREYQVKAVFLFNFAQFVDWPAAAFAAADAPLVIAILGEDPFGPVLDEVVRDEKAGLHPIVIRRCRRVGEAAACHILFISRSEATRLDSILAALPDRGILTVSDAEKAARRGVMIRFVYERNRNRLRINPYAPRRAGLTVSSKLLRSAEIVGTTP